MICACLFSSSSFTQPACSDVKDFVQKCQQRSTATKTACAIGSVEEAAELIRDICEWASGQRPVCAHTPARLHSS